MKKLIALILIAPTVMAQVQTETYVDQRVYQPRMTVMPPNANPNYWRSLQVPYNQAQIIRTPVPVPLPTVQQTQPLPGQTPEQIQQLQQMVR